MSDKTILLDTNAFSRLMQGDEFVIRSADEAKRIFLCSVVLGELESGFRGGTRYDENRRDLADFCGEAKVMKIFSSEKTALIYGELMSALRKAGTMIPTNDVWIGAFAKEANAAILSFDHHMQALIPHGVRLIETEEASHGV